VSGGSGCHGHSRGSDLGVAGFPGFLGVLRDGERRATPRTLGKIAATLSELADRQSDAARILRDAMDGEEAT